jgi:hypothetical protein
LLYEGDACSNQVEASVYYLESQITDKYLRLNRACLFPSTQFTIPAPPLLRRRHTIYNRRASWATVTVILVPQLSLCHIWQLEARRRDECVLFSLSLRVILFLFLDERLDRCGVCMCGAAAERHTISVLYHHDYAPAFRIRIFLFNDSEPRWETRLIF